MWFTWPVHRPVYTQTQIGAHFRKIIAFWVLVFRKLRVFLFLHLFSVKIIWNICFNSFHENGYVHTLQQKYKPCFELPENSVLRRHKVQYRNQHHDSERYRDLYMCHQNPRTRHILDRKTNELQNMSRNICDRIFVVESFVFSYAENSGIQNMPKSCI